MKCYNRTIPSPSGRPMANKYSRVADTDGKIVLKCIGQENLHLRMQEQNKYTNLKELVKRAAIGDSTAIPEPITTEGEVDLTKRPENLISALNAVNKGRQIFDSLSAETKRLYDNDFATFASYVDSNPFGRPENIEKLKNNIAKAKEEKTDV